MQIPTEYNPVTGKLTISLGNQPCGQIFQTFVRKPYPGEVGVLTETIELGGVASSLLGGQPLVIIPANVYFPPSILTPGASREAVQGPSGESPGPTGRLPEERPSPTCAVAGKSQKAAPFTDEWTTTLCLELAATLDQYRPVASPHYSDISEVADNAEGPADVIEIIDSTPEEEDINASCQ